MGAVDIWHVDLAAATSDPVCHLTADETFRASRFRGKDDRRRWVRSRLALRAVLAAYSGQRASQLRFAYGPFGKPHPVSAQGSGRAVHFNVTRSGELCLIAVSRDHQLGIDVECIGGEGGEDASARQFFTAREAAMIGALSGERKARAFLDLWTRKEAYTKAVGLGLQHPLSHLDMLPPEAGEAPSRDDRPAGWRLMPGEASPRGGPGGWHLMPLDLADGFVGTLAADTPRNTAALARIDVRHLAFNRPSVRAAEPIPCDMLQERAP